MPGRSSWEISIMEIGIWFALFLILFCAGVIYLIKKNGKKNKTLKNSDVVLRDNSTRS